MGKESFPNLCVCVGAQKSATSWLYKMIQDHPEISVASQKEINFFNEDENFNKGIEWYKNQFINSGISKVAVGVSPAYLSDNKVPERMRETFPETKIIVCLRDPVSRAKSHIRHLMSKGLIPKKFELQDILKKHPSVIENSLYGKHLSRFLKLFDKKQVHIIHYDQIKNNPEEVVKKVFNFLDVDDSFFPKRMHEKYNSSVFRMSRIHKWMNSIYFKLIKNRPGRAILNFLRKIGLNSHTIVGLYTRLKGEKSYLTLSKADEDFLYSFFIDDQKALKHLLEK